MRKYWPAYLPKQAEKIGPTMTLECIAGLSEAGGGGQITPTALLLAPAWILRPSYVPLNLYCKLFYGVDNQITDPQINDFIV